MSPKVSARDLGYRIFRYAVRQSILFYASGGGETSKEESRLATAMTSVRKAHV